MNSFLLIMMALLVVLMFTKSTKKARMLGKDSEYISAYTKILKKEDGAEEFLDEYIAKENNQPLLNKARIIKLFKNLEEERDTKEVLDTLDFSAIFDDNAVSAPEKVSQNSDMFIWLVLCLAKAKKKTQIEVMNNLYEKVAVFDEPLSKTVEYNIFKSAYGLLLDKGESDKEFLYKLLSGDYVDYVYDKQLIGVNKKIAASLLSYCRDEISDEDKTILNDFAITQVGNILMRDLDILDEYFIKEETKEEE